MRARATITALLLTLAPSACRSRDPRPQQEPRTVPATTAAEVPPPPPLVVLHQRDDRDVVHAASFLSVDRTVVLLTFRTPNRHREAGGPPEGR